MNALEGEWRCVAARIDGRDLAAETTESLRLVLRGGRYLTRRGESVLLDSTYTLASDEQPARIDIAGTGPFEGQAALGIYALVECTLRLCYTMPPGPRPVAFESPAGAGVHLTVWEPVAAAGD